LNAAAIGLHPSPAVLAFASVEPLPGATPGKLFLENEAATMEETLKMLRNLVAVLIALVLILGGLMISQFQEIRRNRDTMLAMRRQANEAVNQFTPQLDERMKHLDDQIAGLDAKMQGSEDRFIQRLDAELPKMLDRYIANKRRELDEAARRQGQQRP
jgi:uncharacterized protein HemX